MHSHLNLAHCLDWPRLLTELGVQIGVRVLPLTVRCPLCGVSQLSIFQHFTLGGQWYRCGNCKQNGDLFELAGRIWNVDFKSVVRKCRQIGALASQNTTEDDVAQHEFFTKFRHRINAVWSAASQDQIYRTEAMRLARRLIWHIRHDVSWRHQGIDQMIGCCQAAKLEEALVCKIPCKRGRTSWTDGAVCNPSRNRIFMGGNWHSVLLTPYYDLPGRIVGFHVAGRQLEHGKDQFYLCADPLDVRSNREAGLQLHPALFDYADEMLAVRGLRWYMRLQSRHLLHHADPLPMCSWAYDNVYKTKTAWQALKAKQIVFWDTAIDDVTLLQAIRCEAKISVTSCTSEQSLELNTQSVPACDFIMTRISGGRPWQEAFDRQIHLQRMSEVEIEALVLSMSEHGAELQRLLTECSSRTVRLLKKVLQRLRPARSVSYEGHRVEQRPDGIYVSKVFGATRRVCNGVLRIDRLIWYPESKDVDYHGRLISGDRLAEFSVDKDTLQRNMPRWLEETSLAAGIPVVRCEPSWCKHLLDTALLFHRPATETGLERIGWSAERAEFVLPNCSIRYGGQIAPHSCFRRTVHTPGDIQGHPERIAALPRLLEPSPASQAFWHVYSRVVSNIVAPALDEDQQQILWINSCHESVIKAVCRACGCAEINPAQDGFETHTWPVYSPLFPQYACKALPTNSTPAPIVTRTGWAEAVMIWLRQSSRIFSIYGPTEVTMDCSGMEWLLFEYLKHLCSTKFENVSTSKDVPDSLMAFVNSLAHTNFELRSDNIREYKKESDAGKLLAQMVSRLYAQGYVAMRPLTSESRLDCVWYDDDLTYVPKRLIRKTLQQVGCNEQELDEFDRRLALEPNVKGEDLVNGLACWCVTRAWLTKVGSNERNRGSYVTLKTG